MAGATQAGQYQTGIIVALAQITLVASLLIAISAPGHRRFFWIGFVLTAVIYLIVARPTNGKPPIVFTQQAIDYAFQNSTLTNKSG